MPMKAHSAAQLAALVAGLVFTARSAQAQVAVFEGTPGRPGNVLLVGSTPDRPAGLQGIQLLPIDCVGRTQLSDLLPDHCRMRTDVPAAARLLLPMEQGSLYRFRRDTASGAAFGYFVVGANGVARSVLELPGTGPLASDDPLPNKVAVTADGTAFLASSSLAAGGDLWEVDLGSGSAVNRTEGIDAQLFHRNGLALCTDWGLGVSDRGVFRFDRSAGARATSVVLRPSQRWFGSDVVASADGSTVALVAGDDSTHAFVFTCKSGGDALQATTHAMNLPGAGFLPEAVAGPTLALSTDGSRLAWKSQDSSGECWLRDLRPGIPPQDVQVTGSANFDNTLNETGVIAFLDLDSIVLIVGRSQSDGIGKADFYRVDLGAGGSLSATNLTRTSGLVQVPFDYGHLSTADGIYQAPGANPCYVVHDSHSASQGTLLWIDPDIGALPFQDQVASLDSMDPAGSYIVAGVHRPVGVDDPLRDSINLLQIPHGAVGTTVTVLPQGCRLSRHVGSRSRSRFAAVLELETGELFGRADVPSTNGLALTKLPFAYGPTTGMLADGSVLASLTLSGVRVEFSWSELGTQVLRSSPGDSFLLPGL